NQAALFFPPPPPRARSRRCPARILQRGVQIDSGNSPRGSQPEKNSCKNRKQQCEQHHAPVDAYISEPRDALCAQYVDPFHTPEAQNYSEQASAQAEQDTFGKQLPDDPPTART